MHLMLGSREADVEQAALFTPLALGVPPAGDVVLVHTHHDDRSELPALRPVEGYEIEVAACSTLAGERAKSLVGKGPVRFARGHEAAVRGQFVLQTH